MDNSEQMRLQVDMSNSIAETVMGLRDKHKQDLHAAIGLMHSLNALALSVDHLAAVLKPKE